MAYVPPHKRGGAVASDAGAAAAAAAPVAEGGARRLAGAVATDEHLCAYVGGPGSEMVEGERAVAAVTALTAADNEAGPAAAGGGGPRAGPAAADGAAAADGGGASAWSTHYVCLKIDSEGPAARALLNLQTRIIARCPVARRDELQRAADKASTGGRDLHMTLGSMLRLPDGDAIESAVGCVQRALSQVRQGPAWPASFLLTRMGKFGKTHAHTLYASPGGRDRAATRFQQLAAALDVEMNAAGLLHEPQTTPRRPNAFTLHVSLFKVPDAAPRFSHADFEALFEALDVNVPITAITLVEKKKTLPVVMEFAL